MTGVPWRRAILTVIAAVLALTGVVVALRADVAWVDPVFGQRLGHLRVLDEQLVAVVVEVTDDRRADTQAVEFAADLRHGHGCGVVVYRHSDQL